MAGGGGRGAPAMEVIYWRALGPRGDTVLDPVFAELLFLLRWRQLTSVALTPSRYPHIPALGPLPAALEGGPAGGPRPRDELLRAAAALGAAPARPAGSGGAAGGAAGGERPSAGDGADDAFCALLRRRVGEALECLLYMDDGIWEDYTRPTLLRSAPAGCGWAVAWRERRRRCGAAAADAKQDRCAAAFLGLEDALVALAERLAERDSFGGTQDAEAAGAFTPLDACAYGHLAVLFSIPCQRGSRLGELLDRFGALAQFCDRAELRLEGVWPDHRSFLVGVDSSLRLPSAIGAPPTTPSASPKAGASCASPAAGAPPAWRGAAWRGASGAEDGGSPAGPRAGDAAAAAGREVREPALAWWELWGWSWRGAAGEARRPATAPRPKVRKQAPPAWYAPAFAAAAAAALGGAALAFRPAASAAR